MLHAMTTVVDCKQLAAQIKKWGIELGFAEIKICDPKVAYADQHLQNYLDKNYHGSMTYLERNRDLRAHPEKLVPGTTRIIMARMDYLPENPDMQTALNDKNRAYVSRYAVGKDYHKLIRKRLAKLAKMIAAEIGEFNSRPFADSAPVFEKDLAAKAGLGWMGKNTLILNRQAGSWFFLGSLYTDLPLPVDPAVTAHCGSCNSCIDVCPTKAIVAPYVLNASRCISYLTIENKGVIPEEFRKAIGNRIFGCDDCQIVCPWNKFAKVTPIKEFHARHRLDQISLIEAFSWSETEFLQKTEGSAMRRINHECWLRNIAVALGNAPCSAEVISALKSRLNYPSALVQEHIQWALQQLT